MKSLIRIATLAVLALLIHTIAPAQDTSNVRGISGAGEITISNGNGSLDARFTPGPVTAAQEKPQNRVKIAAGGFVDEFRFDQDSPLKNLRGIWYEVDVQAFGPKKGHNGFRGGLVFNGQRTFDRTIFENYPMPAPDPVPLPAAAMPMPTAIVTADIRRDVNNYSGGFRLSYVTKRADPFGTVLFGRTGLDEYKYSRRYQAGLDIHFTEDSPLFLRAGVEGEVTGGVLAHTSYKTFFGGGIRF